MIERLRLKFETEIKARTEMLTGGHCTDYTQYRVVCAEIKILEDSIGLLRDFYVEDEVDA